MTAASPVTSAMSGLAAPAAEAPDKYAILLARCAGLPPIPTAVAHPCDAASLGGALQAAELGLIVPILVGPAARIRQVAAEQGMALGNAVILDAPHSHASAARAVEAVRAGDAELLMKSRRGQITGGLLDGPLAFDSGRL